MKTMILLLLLPMTAWATKPPTQVQSQYQQQQTSSYANAYAGGGSSYAGGGSVDIDNPRQAPAVGLVVPPSTMDCAKGFGFGGSNYSGGALIGWSWIQRDCLAMQQFQLLRGLGEHKAAASAYCARPLFRKPFGSKDSCYAALSTPDQPTEQRVITIRVSDGQAECRATGETMIKEVIDDGTTLFYDCRELRGKGQ